MAETEGIADTADAVDHPSSALDSLMVSQDASEGMTAFAQKRRPEWKNR
jgi:acetyl-CoA C-acetyltransferase